MVRLNEPIRPMGHIDVEVLKDRLLLLPMDGDFLMAGRPDSKIESSCGYLASLL